MFSSESLPVSARRQNTNLSHIKIRPRPKGTGTYTSSMPTNADNTRLNSSRRITKYKEDNKPKRIESYIKNREIKQENEEKEPEKDLDKIENVACRLLEGESLEIVNKNDAPDVITFLKEYSTKQSLSRNYAEAKIALNLIEGLQKYTNVEEQPKPNTAIVESALAEENHDEMVKDHIEELKLFDEQTEKKRELLDLQQKNKMDEFEKDWAEYRPRKYRKPSAKLLGYAQIEHQVALAGDYDYALQIKNQAEIQMEKETRIAQKQLIADYNNGKKRLEEDFKKQIELFEDTRKKQRELIVQRQQKELGVVMKRIDVAYLRSIENHRQVESSMNSPRKQSREPTITRLRYMIESQQTKLLPELIPPNDPRIKEIAQKDREDREKQKKKEKKQLKNQVSSRLFSPKEKK